MTSFFSSISAVLVGFVEGYSVLGLPDPLPLGGAALPLARMRRQAASKPYIQALATHALCDPENDGADKCEVIIFSGKDAIEPVKCRFTPIVVSHSFSSIMFLIRKCRKYKFTCDK